MRRKKACLLLVVILVLSSVGFAYAGQTYTVKPGDVLWKIAQNYNMTYQELAKYNNLNDPNKIYPNQTIKIPESNSAASTAPTQAPSPASTNQDAADTVLMNGTVFTIDAANTCAEAIAYKGGKIIFVGSNSDAKAYIETGTKVGDLNGKIVMPGFVDTRVHPPGIAKTELYI
jgi:spore germination protein YaaH